MSTFQDTPSTPLVVGSPEQFEGTDADDHLDGGDGDDQLIGGRGHDHLYGGAFSSTLVQHESEIRYDGSGSSEDEWWVDDWYYYYYKSENMVLVSGGHDQLWGGDGDDEVEGGDGDDVLYGGDGQDYLYGGVLGTFDSEKHEEELHSESGADDHALIDTQSAQLVNGGHDQLYGEAGDDVIVAGDGNDTAYGGDGDDMMHGGAATTWLTAIHQRVQATSVRVFNQQSAMSSFTVDEQSTEEVLVTGGDDYLAGGAGQDTLDGGDGNDELVGGTGDDVVYGGQADVLQRNHEYFKSTTYSAAASTEEAWQQYQQYYISGGQDLLFGEDGLDQLYGGDGHDVLYGGADADYLDGGAAKTYTLNAMDRDGVLTATHWAVSGGDDQLYGGAGTDQLVGGDGNDRLDGGADADIMRGGTGRDYYYQDDLGDVIIELASQGIDTVESVISITLGEHIENLVLYGHSRLQGIGNSTHNTLTAQGTGHHLQGMAGDDVLYGGAGQDTLDGGIGRDRMYGGAGDDVYIRNHTQDLIVESAGHGIDTVHSSISMILGDHLENLTLIGSTTANAVGNQSDNLLRGNHAANRLDGRQGNDLLRGSGGNDSYVMKRGYGQDVVIDTDATIGNQDQVLFGSGIAADQLWFAQVGQDLQVSIIGTTDAIRIKNWYQSVDAQVEQWVLANGRTLAHDQVQYLVDAMASLSPPVMGQTQLNQEQHQQLDHLIAAYW